MVPVRSVRVNRSHFVPPRRVTTVPAEASGHQAEKDVAAMATRAIVGEKVGMTQVWDDDNRVVPVTVLRVRPCRVVQVKTNERDGYSALQVTFGHRKPSKLTKPVAGQYDKAGVDPGTRLVELRLDDVSEYEVGQEIGADVLAQGELVDVTSVSKGKGTSGVMKRHGFAGLGASHGAHRVHRAPGAIGACATPSRVFRGTRMAGRAGGQKTTTLNLTVVQADAERDLLLVKGSVPGPKGGIVLVRDAAKGS
jgi:large subunit ribosomal protein L3